MRTIAAVGLLLSVAAGGSWGNARELPGIPALNTGVFSKAVVGQQAMVADER